LLSFTCLHNLCTKALSVRWLYGNQTVSQVNRRTHGYYPAILLLVDNLIAIYLLTSAHLHLNYCLRGSTTYKINPNNTHYYNMSTSRSYFHGYG
jgi:hypothetical protein